MGIRFKLNNLRIIISEVLPFFLLIAFSADSFLLTFSTPSIWYVIYDVQINADFKQNANIPLFLHHSVSKLRLGCVCAEN